MAKRYIGDGVYIDFDGYGIELTTEDGINVTNRIILEPEVYGSLLEYVRALKEAPSRQSAPESAQPCGRDHGASWVCEAHR